MAHLTIDNLRTIEDLDRTFQTPANFQIDFFIQGERNSYFGQIASQPHLIGPYLKSYTVIKCGDDGQPVLKKEKPQLQTLMVGPTAVSSVTLPRFLDIDTARLSRRLCSSWSCRKEGPGRLGCRLEHRNSVRRVFQDIGSTPNSWKQ